MTLEKMKLVAYSDEKFQTEVSGGSYTVMLNPESLKWDRKIHYNKQQAPDSSNASQKYKYTPGGKLSFDIVIDCTGVVDSSRVDLPTEVNKLQKIVYDYNGDIHRPNLVKINWGKNLEFKGVLTNYDISYNLFKPDGTPLRAKVSLKFDSYIDPVTEARIQAPASPDMTHLVDVTEGDTLPQLCQKIWNDSSYYVQVARFNDLNKFRKLEAGSALIFPPIIPASQ